MQSLPIYLYPNNFDVILDLDATIRGVNRVMYQRDLKIQKGIKNTVRIQFKNSDQKRIPIDDTDTFVFSMYDAINRRLLVEKTLQVIDDGTTLATRGIAELTLTESDTIDLDRSEYSFSVKRRDPADGTYSPAYSNAYYGVSGTLSLLEDAYPVLQPSQEIVAFQKRYNADSQLYEYKSGNVYAYPEYNSNSALHTVALYMTNYKGYLRIEGTLSNQPDNFGNYAHIETILYTGFSGIDYRNFNGVYTYIRVTHIPATAPGEATNDNPSFFGSFDRALYRS